MPVELFYDHQIYIFFSICMGVGGGIIERQFITNFDVPREGGGGWGLVRGTLNIVSTITSTSNVLGTRSVILMVEVPSTGQSKELPFRFARARYFYAISLLLVGFTE